MNRLFTVHAEATTGFVIAIQLANNSIKEIYVDRIPHIISCHLQSVNFYGVDIFATRTLLGTFLNDDRLGFVRYIRTLRYDNDFIVTWEESLDCLPHHLSISLNSRKGVIDEQELEQMIGMAKFQYIPQDELITVCVTATHLYDYLAHLTTCTQENSVFKPQTDVNLELVTQGRNLISTWTENDEDIQYLIFLLIKDEIHHSTDYLPTNETAHIVEKYDPCVQYMAVLYMTTNLDVDYLLDAALYEPGRWFVTVV
ncbi:hypothetical protein P879_03949 [Paragonimus westermani]|uniref:Uncharacterized protein n=1 Tax=Paragonimus westermani TaxID=34504 RepID=A0A8T0DFB9_9TREM|nr:hypothetical protein P879_03949 [Paragonimus westermani]